MHLTKLICSINESLKKIFDKYSGIVLYDGLASIAIKDGVTMPVIIDKFGQAKYIGADDRNTVSIYHKNTGLLISQRLQGSFGNSISLQVYTYTNTMIVYMDRKKLGGMMPDELLLYLQAGLLEKIDITNYKSILIRFTGANLNSAQVFNQEYPGLENKMRLEQNLFSVSYQMEAVLDSACLPICIPKCV